jgi:quinol monooxygenase YgiN
LRATYNQQAVPKVRACAGNLACLLLEPAGASDPFIAVTIWDRRAAAEAYEASGAAAQVVDLVRGFFAGPPTLRSYESASESGIGLGPAVVP